MTNEENSLLLKDLCGRLPYGITVQQSAQYPKGHFAYDTADKWQTEPHDFKIIGVEGTNTLITDKRKEERTYAKGIVSSPITICIHNGFTRQEIKPYLRPMSSMTEEEAMEVARIRGLKDILSVSLKENYIFVELDDGVFGSELCTIWFNEMVTSIEMLDWLNSHHFDYRGLIPMGLALEAPEGMYNIQ